MKTWRLFTLAWLAITFFSCGLAQSPPSSRVIPISQFGQIAGTWEGLSKRMPDMRNHAQVLLIIREKGYFHFVSDRATGLFLGTGTLTMQDGRALASADTGTGTFTLHDRAGMQVLVGEVVLKDSHHYYLDMTRSDGNVR